MKRRNAVITGASKGIGLAIARQLVNNDYNCVLMARDPERLSMAVDTISQPESIVFAVKCDVTQPEQIAQALSTVRSELGAIDVLVNCAGRPGGGVTAELSDELWLDVINANLNSVFFMTRQVLREELIDAGGAIINIASTGGKQFPLIKWRLTKAASGQPLDVSGQWQLSVSHSAGYLAIALSKPSCGVDLEVLRHNHRWRELYEWITPSPARLCDPTPTDFLRAWTTKEALLKWQGLGLDGGLHHQPVPERDSLNWQVLMVDQRFTHVRHERLHREMSLSLVCEQPLPVHWQVSPDCLEITSMFRTQAAATQRTTIDC